MKGSTKSQIYFIISTLSAIGISKRETRNDSTIKGQNGRQVSEKAHSYKYINDIKNTAKQLGNFAQINFQIKNFEKINNEVVLAYIKTKVDDGLAFRTISTYISHLEKISLAIQKISKDKQKNYECFDRNGLKECTLYKIKNAKKSAHINRAYVNPELIISNLKHVDNVIVALTQLQGGVRIAEALKFKPEQMLEDNKVEVRIKGGNKLIVTLSSIIYNEINKRVKTAMSKGKVGYKISYLSFYNDLKKAVEMSGEIWTGTHGLRYTYAQKRTQQLALDGMSPLEGQKIISVELGHQRPSVTLTYTS